MHSSFTFRGHDGVERRGLCRLLQLWSRPECRVKHVTDHNSPGNGISDFDGQTCPIPLRDYKLIVMGHGGGGTLSRDLVEHLFLPAFHNEFLAGLGDSTILRIGEHRLAFSTDSYVIRPLFFPGGSLGDLAVNGTVNDLAMSGAIPLYLSAGFIIEEGFPLESRNLNSSVTRKRNIKMLKWNYFKRDGKLLKFFFTTKK